MAYGFRIWVLLFSYLFTTEEIQQKKPITKLQFFHVSKFYLNNQQEKKRLSKHSMKYKHF